MHPISRFTNVTLVTHIKPQVRGHIRSFYFSKNIYLGSTGIYASGLSNPASVLRGRQLTPTPPCPVDKVVDKLL
jgi:hypothetical protein